MRRLLALLLVAGPLFAAAQTSGSINFAPDNVIARAGCIASSPQDVALTWAAALDGITVAVGGEFRIYASNTAPTDNKYCATVNNGAVFAALVATVSNGSTSSATTVTSRSVETQLIAAAAGETACTTGSPTVYVCVHWHENSGSTTPQAYAKGTMILKLDGPAAPTVTTVEPGERALNVWITAATTGVEATKFRARAVAADNVTHLSPETAIGSKARIDGLTNGVPYDVTAFTYTAEGNESPESCKYKATGTAPACTGGTAVEPVSVADAWEHYVDDGGRDSGGCQTGGAGLLALLGAASLPRLRRRR